MHPELIKAHAAQERIKPRPPWLEKQACRLKMSSHVIRGRHSSLRIARRICEVTGLQPDTAWPGRYPEFRFNPIAFKPHHSRRSHEKPFVCP
jgi:lambda repressor-like predicted transcriptional regulator